MTRAIRFTEIGGPEVLKVENVTLGAPGPGHARLHPTHGAANSSHL